MKDIEYGLNAIKKVNLSILLGILLIYTYILLKIKIS
jgi:hypothetical protein